MIQWRKEPWDPLSLTLSLTGRYLYDRVLTCLRPEEKSQKKYLVQRKVRENQQRHVISAVLTRIWVIFSTWHKRIQSSSYWRLKMKSTLGDPRLSRGQWTSSRASKESPTQRREPVIFCSRSPEGRSRENKHGGSKKIYKRKKWVYFVSDVRENPYMERLF